VSSKKAVLGFETEAKSLENEKKTSPNAKKAKAEESSSSRKKSGQLSAYESEAHSTNVYIDLIKGLLLSGEVKEATEILEKMPVQGWTLPTYVCNLVILPWIEQGGALGLREARKILEMMKSHHIKPNERTVSLALVVALARHDGHLVTEMLQTMERSAFDPIRIGTYFQQHGGLKKAQSSSATEFVKEIMEGEGAELFGEVMNHAEEFEKTKDSLSLPVYNAPPLVEELSLDPLYREQLNLETRANQDAVQKYRSAMQEVINLGRGANMAPAQDILLLWYEPLVRAISEEHRRIGAKDSARDRSVYGPKLLSVDAERLAVITIHEVLGLLMANPSGVKFVTLAQGIGSAVQAEWRFAKARQEGNQLVSYLRSTGELLTVNTVNKVTRFSQKDGQDSGWGAKLLVKVGGVLIELLSSVARVPPNLSHLELAKYKKENGGLSRVVQGEDWPLAFRHGYRFAGKKKFGTIYCLPEVLETIENGHKLRETVNARYLPMLVVPRPWTGPMVGGYLAYKNWVMRTKGSELQRQSLMDAQISPVYEALDILGSTAWRINKFVKEVAEKAWAAGGGELDLPSRTDLVIPTPPVDFADDVKARKKFQALQRKIVQQQRDLHGLRCALKYQLAVASEFQDRVFYFPHNLDFRGRSYPIPPHLNQMGSDLCRGLLNFAEAKPLGASGLRWLKIHIANLFGNDKITHEERLAFVNDHIDEVRHSARDPLGEGNWWKKADSPWQILGACHALDEALSCPVPEEYLCNIPIHQDGSCNGLQHYAALGGIFLF
jgi:DNA-directed RNA polymerase